MDFGVHLGMSSVLKRLSSEVSLGSCMSASHECEVTGIAFTHFGAIKWAVPLR